MSDQLKPRTAQERFVGTKFEGSPETCKRREICDNFETGYRYAVDRAKNIVSFLRFRKDQHRVFAPDGELYVDTLCDVMSVKQPFRELVWDIVRETIMLDQAVN